MSYRLAADVGGTFTDIVLLNDDTGVYETTKVLTTPEALEKGILKGFDELAGDKYDQIASIVQRNYFWTEFRDRTKWVLPRAVG